jgi:tRNA-dihydrouridine synthase 3
MGAGSMLMGKATRLHEMLLGMNKVLDCPVTLKMRTGISNELNQRNAHKIIQKIRIWSLTASMEHGLHQPLVNGVTIHGRTRQQRYSKYADWDYIGTCVDAGRAGIEVLSSQLHQENYFCQETIAKANALNPDGIQIHNDSYRFSGTSVPAIPVIGNGDVLSWQEYYSHVEQYGTTSNLLARGVLIKPWLLTEIKERRDWDISSAERLGILRSFVNEGLIHWGSDQLGVNKTRRFLLEWLSFLHRYVPLGLLEHYPQKIGQKPVVFYGRDDLETLMGSDNAVDWVRISELLLGKAPDDFSFLPKHKSNSYVIDSQSRVSVSSSGFVLNEVTESG